jgi:hypothetical protein
MRLIGLSSKQVRLWPAVRTSAFRWDLNGEV